MILQNGPEKFLDASFISHSHSCKLMFSPGFFLVVIATDSNHGKSLIIIAITILEKNLL